MGYLSSFGGQESGSPGSFNNNANHVVTADLSTANVLG